MEKQSTEDNMAKQSDNNKSGNDDVNKSENCVTGIGEDYCNPSIHPDRSEHVDEDLSRMRGDAIGNTLYSERFVLSTLLKLTKVEKELAENECFENDLCSVWDMTIEEDVVRLLLEHNVLELFADSINATEDRRLVEILVGILGNMCNFKEAREALVEDNNLVQELLVLTNCSDSLTLLQLTRLFSVVLIHSDQASALQWYRRICSYPDFVKNIAFILNNSISEQLLRQTVETLNAILAKFALVEPNAQKRLTKEDDDLDIEVLLPTFEQLFVDQSLIEGTTEAFLALLPRKDTTELQDNDDDDDESIILPSQSTHNLMQIFLNIHCILTQYDDLSQNCYKPHIEPLLYCLSCILEPLSHPKYVPHLSNRDQDLLDSVNDVLESLGDPFDESCLVYAIRIWNLLREENERIARKTPPANDFEDDTIKEDDFNFETSYLTILDFIVRMINAATEVQLQEFLKENNDDNLKNLQSTLSIGDNDQSTRLCHSKIQRVLESIQKK